MSEFRSYPAEARIMARDSKLPDLMMRQKEVDEALSYWADLAIDPHAGYLRKAGEIEARDTAARAGLSDIQRMSEMPYASQGIPLDEWIVNFRGGNAASMLKDIVPPTKAEADKMLRESGISEGAIKEALDKLKKKKGSAVKRASQSRKA